MTCVTPGTNAAQLRAYFSRNGRSSPSKAAAFCRFSTEKRGDKVLTSDPPKTVSDGVSSANNPNDSGEYAKNPIPLRAQNAALFFSALRSINESRS